MEKISGHDRLRDRGALAPALLIALGLAPALRAQTPTLSKEYIRLGGRILAMETCLPALSGVPAYDDNPHSGTISVTVNAGCSWTVTGFPGWITINSGLNGTGNGTISYNVAANTTGADRSATFTVAGQTFAVTQYTPMRFVTVAPCRVFDTRNPAGPFGGPSIAAGAARSFPVPSSACGIPASALAYSVNVTVLPSGPLGYLTVWPTGLQQPAVSLMNSDGRIKANAAIVAAGTGGAISVYATNQTDVALDIDGYFVSSTTAGSLAYYPVTPCRLVDTRGANGQLGGPQLGAGQTRTFPLLSGSCGILSTAQAYSLNFTAIPPASLLYITAWPAGQTQPAVSTLNDPTGTVVANAAIVPVGTGGSINVYATAATDLLIDIDGYFAAPGSGGLSLYAVAPCRVLDTRGPQGGSPPFSGTLNVNVAPNCLLPWNAGAYVLNATAIPSQALVYLTLWAQGQPQPPVSTLNAYDAAITSNMALVPATNGSISAYAANPTQILLDTVGYFAP